MSLLLEAKSMPALIIEPRFILVTYTDDLGWYITSNQQGKMFVQNLNRIVRKLNVTPRQFPYCKTNSIPIDLMFQKNLDGVKMALGIRMMTVEAVRKCTKDRKN